jgi:hypothetical protein
MRVERWGDSHQLRARGATGVMKHPSSCANAKGPASECQCSCGGDKHGSGRVSSRDRLSAGRSAPAWMPPVDRLPPVTTAPSSGLWAALKEARTRRRTAAEKARQERQCAAIERAKDEINDWLAATVVGFPGAGIAVAATNAAMDAVSDDIANVIVGALNRNGCFDPSGSGHILCDFLASIACAMQKFRDQFQHHMVDIVKAILKSRKKENRSVIPGPVATVAAQAAVNVLTKLQSVHHFDDMLRAVRLLAISVCPAPEKHKAVVQCCLSPLEVYVLSDAIKQDLKDELPRGWIART